MAVVFHPEFQSSFIDRFAKTRKVICGNQIGHQAAQIPEKAVGEVGTAQHSAAQHGQPGPGIVTQALGEYLFQAGCPVLRPHLVAVDHHMLQRAPLFGRHPIQKSAYVGVEVMPAARAAHFVHFITCGLWRHRHVDGPGGQGAAAQDDPVPFRHFPAQSAVGIHEAADVYHRLRVQGFPGFRLIRPKIGIPSRHWLGIHFAQLLFGQVFHDRTAGKGDLPEARPPVRAQIAEHQAEMLEISVGYGYGEGRPGHGPEAPHVAVPVKMSKTQPFIRPAIGRGQHLHLHAERPGDGMQRQSLYRAIALQGHVDLPGASGGRSRKMAGSCLIAVEPVRRSGKVRG